MAGIAAAYVRAGRGGDVARVSLRLGLVAGFAACVLTVVSGDRHARQVAHTQPAKFAAMEGLYSTEPGAPLILFSLPPTQAGRRNGPELLVTHLTSLLAFGNVEAPVRGLSEFPRADWPPVAVTFLAFHNMVIVGNLMLLVTLVGLALMVRGRLERSRTWLRLMTWAIALPVIAIQLGWLAAEVGRQPWIVYGLLRTRDAVSRVVPASSVLFSLVLFSLVYTALGALWLHLLRREIAHGPEPAEAAHA
jgi:cytochrome d ubiquinol oxidase subunit I